MAAAKKLWGALFGWEAGDMPAGDTGTYALPRKGGDESPGSRGEPGAIALSAAGARERAPVRAPSRARPRR